jgi:hypothetical protein
VTRALYPTLPLFNHLGRPPCDFAPGVDCVGMMRAGGAEDDRARPVVHGQRTAVLSHRVPGHRRMADLMMDTIGTGGTPAAISGAFAGTLGLVGLALPFIAFAWDGLVRRQMLLPAFPLRPPSGNRRPKSGGSELSPSGCFASWPVASSCWWREVYSCSPSRATAIVTPHSPVRARSSARYPGSPGRGLVCVWGGS